MHYITFFTDGSVRRDFNMMSYAWVQVENDEIVDLEVELLEGKNSAEAEVRGILLALEKIESLYTQDSDKRYLLVSDCEYCVKAINLWLEKWIEEDRHVKFLEEWKKIHNIVQRIPVYFFWVKGHNGTYYNEIVDEFCKDALKTYHSENFSDLRSRDFYH